MMFDQNDPVVVSARAAFEQSRQRLKDDLLKGNVVLVLAAIGRCADNPAMLRNAPDEVLQYVANAAFIGLSDLLFSTMDDDCDEADVSGAHGSDEY